MKVNDKKITPQLRFPEFKNSGEWEEKKLGELTLDVNERNKSDLTTVLSVTNTYGIVEQEDFFQRIVASEDLSNYKVIRKGDIAYNPSRINVGSVDVLQNNDIGVMSPMYVIVRCKENILNNEFLKQWLLSNTFYSLMEKNLQGGVRKSLPYNIFKNIEIVTPPLKEQQKIADFLSSVDKLIDNEKIKLENLKEYKKGLLQNLFPKENQKVPDLRFPEFENDGEWEEKKLGDIVDIYDNLRQPIAKYNRIQGYYPYYGANGIMDYINDYIFDGTYLLIGEDGSVINRDNSPVMHIATGKFWVNNHAHVVKEKTQLYNLYFIYYVLHTTNIEGFVKGIPPKLNQENLRQLSIIATNIEEQQKIADFLSSVDELIIEQIKKIEIMQEYKKGLLQKLFL